MRWFAPIVIVAVVAAGATRPADAMRARDRASMSASTSNALATKATRVATWPAKLAPRRAPMGRTAASDRRSDLDEVFVVPRVIELVAIPVLSRIALPVPIARRATLVVVDEVARGPPSRVVLFHPRS
ncbi:MAG: hypothetical protein AB7T06_17540 [Kofleriaceae bacterium]